MCGRNSKKHNDWKIKVFERDNYFCQHCGSNKNLHAHHVIKWDEDESLRFILDNGLTLCSSCHTKHHVPHKGHSQIPWNKGKKTGVGGPLGIKLSNERKDFISKINKGWIRTDEYKLKLRNAKTKENVEENKVRLKGRTWHIDSLTGKRVWSH